MNQDIHNFIQYLHQEKQTSENTEAVSYTHLDVYKRQLLLFVNSWSVGMVLDRNEGLVLSEFGRE